MNHEAIYVLYPNVQHIDDSTGAHDADGNLVIIDEAAVAIKQAELDVLTSFIQLRSKRNEFLHDSDWTQGNDSQLSAEVKTTWVAYRQTLRDLPANTDDPLNPTWPVKPE